jgi:hypothetical protein
MFSDIWTAVCPFEQTREYFSTRISTSAANVWEMIGQTDFIDTTPIDIYIGARDMCSRMCRLRSRMNTSGSSTNRKRKFTFLDIDVAQVSLAAELFDEPDERLAGVH